MQATILSDIPSSLVTPILDSVPFFANLGRSQPEQLRTLLRYCRLFEAEAGEEVTRKEDYDSWVYFSLRGQLQVYGDTDTENSPILSHIAPGEMFGAIAVLKGCVRSATVVADPVCQHTVLLGMDYSPFGELMDFRLINLETKLHYYRMVLRVLAKHLVNLKIDFPDLANQKKLPRFDLMEKALVNRETLQSLYNQAVKGADILVTWNKVIESVSPDSPSRAELQKAAIHAVDQILDAREEEKDIKSLVSDFTH